MPQTTHFGFPLVADSPPEGMTGKDLRDMILGENDGSLAQMLDAALHKIEKTNADWNEGDETSPAYVKNRPFYTLPDVWEEKTYTFTKTGTVYKAPLSSGTPSFEAGVEYIVVWDDVEYACTAKEIAVKATMSNGGNVTVTFFSNIGNAKLLSDAGEKAYGYNTAPTTSEDTGEPFFMTKYNMGDVGLGIYATTGGTHKLRVYPKNNIKKLDKKYLPDNVGGITAVKVNGAVLTVTNGAVNIPIPSVPAKVSELQNDSGFISGETFSSIEFSVNTMRNNLFLPMAEWDGDTTDHVNILGMFYKVSESTIVPPRVCITLAGRAADGSVSGGMTALSDGVMTDLAEMLGITIFIVENDPILVVAERAGVLPAAVIEQFMGTNPGVDIPYEAGTYVFGQQDNNEFLFIQTAEGVMTIKDYIDAKIEEIKALLTNQT